MKIKVIAVGSTKWDRFFRRWGVSLLIGEDVLFDTFGDPGIFLKNAKRLNIDFSKIRHIVLSHDDWDHVSGLWDIIARYKNLTVYVCPHFKTEIKEKIDSLGVVSIEVKDFLEIRENVFSTGEISVLSEGKCVFEQSLAVKFLKSVTVITGCAHPGIVNIVDRVKQRFPKEKIQMALGGFHLKETPELQVREVILALRARGVAKIAPMHCTGKMATQWLRKEYGIDFVNVGTGSVIEV